MPCRQASHALRCACATHVAALLDEPALVGDDAPRRHKRPAQRAVDHSPLEPGAPEGRRLRPFPWRLHRLCVPWQEGSFRIVGCRWCHTDHA